MKQAAQLALVAVVAATAAAAGYWSRDTPAPAAEMSAPAVAPEAGASLMALTLPDLDGTPQALAQWQDKVLVVNFWATWCPPCRKEIPDFAAVSQRMSDAAVQFVGLSIDRADAVAAFQAQHAVPYPLLIGDTATLQLAASFGNAAQALPFTVILAPGGKIAYIKLGTLKADELEGRIRALLPVQAS